MTNTINNTLKKLRELENDYGILFEIVLYTNGGGDIKKTDKDAVEYMTEFVYYFSDIGEFYKAPKEIEEELRKVKNDLS